MSAPAMTIAVFAGRSASALHATLASVDRALGVLRTDGPCAADIIVLPDTDSPDLREIAAGIAQREDCRVLDPRPRAVARRDAMAEARGDFLACIDEGDLWSDNFLHVALAAARRGGPGHSVWRPEAVLDCGRDFFDYDHRVTLQHVMGDAAAGAVLLQACPFAPSFLVHRAVFANAPMPAADATRGWMDVDAWWIADCLGAGHAQRIAEATVLYRWNPTLPLPHPVRIGPSPLFAARVRA